jgi:hypothetical protein
MLFLLVCGELLFAGRVEALQMHPPSEGPLVHQITHFLFAFSMGILIFWLRQRALVQKPAWRNIQYSALFLIIWNINDMIVHYLDDSVALFQTVGIGAWHGWILPMQASDWLTVFYYLGKMDHLFCVPAIIFLYIGLKQLLNEARHSSLPEIQP